ncbi:MAG: hypothetical protein U0Y10_00705 [Spirosomataceae bacterium]
MGFSFDFQPTLYWLLGLGSLILLGGLSVSALLKPSFKISDTAFLGLALVVLVMMRLPVILFNQELDPDESQNLSHAITLWVDPVYWRSVDGTTIGPLDQYILLLPKLLGLPFDYTTARWVGLGCIVIAIGFFYFAVKLLYSQTVARLAILPVVALLAFTQHNGFVHYSSEHVPLALLSWLLWLFARIITNQGSYYRKFFWLGFLSGLTPFGKLQAVPPIAAIILFILIWLYRERRLQRVRSFERTVLFLLAGGLVFPVFAMAITLYWGVFQDFIKFYIGANSLYGSGLSLADGIKRLPIYFQKIAEFNWFVRVSLLTGAIGLVASMRSPLGDRNRSFITTFSLVWLIASLVAVLKPGNEFTHYLLFLIFPFSLINAWGFSKIIQWLTDKGQVLIPAGMMAIVLAVTTIQSLSKKPMNRYVSSPMVNRALPTSKVTKTIQQYAQPGDTLTVWGWMCRYYVQTQMVEGTAENHTERCVFQHPMRDEYRDRFMKNIEQNRPKVFVDATGPNNQWLVDRATQGHECFPELKEFIKTHYLYVEMVEETRIYVRKKSFANARQ